MDIMKQHITPKQLNELSDKKKLREWWKPKQGDLYFSVRSQSIHTYSNKGKLKVWDYCYYYPLLSIGQMIEFLNETKPDMHIETYHDKKWGVSTCLSEDTYEEEVFKFKKQYKKELADALWEATKEILEG